MFIHNKSIGKLFFLAVLCPILTFADVSWLYSGGQLIEQNVEEGARGWILNVSANGTGFLQFKGVAQSGTNVTGSVTSRRLLDMDAPITNASGVVYKINKLSDDIFNNSTIVDTIVLPSELTSIPRNFLRGDKSTLKRVIIPGDKITSISQFAFYENKSITNITPMVFNSLTYIGNGAFNCCENLAGDFIVNTKNLTLESGNYGTFQKCSKLSSFIVNGDVKGALPKNLFQSCTSLKRVQLSKNPTNLVTSIDLFVFYSCNALTSIYPLRFPKLTFIADGAFHSCSLLKGDFSIESDKLSFGTSANNYGTFYQCKKLNSFKNYGSLTGTLPTRAFHSCSALKELQLTTNKVCKLTSLSTTSIYGCGALTNIHPLVFDRLTTIGKQALDESPMVKGDFIIVGNNSLQIGEEALGWVAGKYTSFSVEGAVTSISRRFLQSCTTVTNVYFGSTIASPGNCFLYGCTALRVLTMPYRPASFGGSSSFDNISVRQMVVRADRRDTGVNGWFNPGKYTPWGELSQSVKNEWLNLSYEAKKARGWQDIKVPRGVTLGLTKNQWLTDIPSSRSLFMLR